LTFIVRTKILRDFSKYLLLCSTEENHTGLEPSEVIKRNDDNFFIFYFFAKSFTLTFANII